LEISFDSGHIDIEFNKISIECVDGVVKKLVVSLLEIVDVYIKFIDDWLDTLKVVQLECSELLDCSEEFDQLGHSSAEQIKFSEDLIWRELELLALWHVHQSLFGELVLLDVRLVELDTALENRDELMGWILLVLPEDIIALVVVPLGCLSSSDLLEVQNVVLTVGYHLVGDLDE